MIVVFLNNKLITCDTIVPLMLELANRRPGQRIEFATFEERTYDAIKKNVVLHDAIREIGTLTLRGRPDAARGSFFRFISHRLKSLAWVAGLAARAVFGNVVFVHFKSLNEWPLRLLAKIAPQRTVTVEPSAIGYAPLEKQVSDLMRPRTYPTVVPAGKYMVGFSDHWPQFTDPRLNDRVKVKLSAPFTSTAWLDYLDQRADTYLHQTFESAGLEPTESFVVYILTWMGPSGLLREVDLFPTLYEETLDALAETCADSPLFLKPHPVMNAAERRWAIETARARSGMKVVATDLHPMVLAHRARFVIGMCYSTTYAVLRYLGVPTVEYTDYAERILDATAGASMRPEFVSHFINRDPALLRQTLTHLGQRGAPAARPAGGQCLDDHLLAVLTGEAKGWQPAPHSFGPTTEAARSETKNVL